MIHPLHLSMISNLEELLKRGDLTPTKLVGSGTIVCITERVSNGILYHQIPFDEMPSEQKTLFKNRTKGETLGMMKIVAIFDTWPEAKKERPPVQVFDN